MADGGDKTGDAGDRGKGAIAALRIAAVFLTRLPVRAPDGNLASAVGVFPVVGAIVGLPAGLAGSAALLLGLPPLAAALIAIFVLALLTGALHEDGLADFADGLAGNSTEESIRIMRDSHIGAFGVLALIFGVGLRATALAAIADPDALWRIFAAAAVLSRTAMPLVMVWLPRASATGLATSAGTPRPGDVLFAVAIGLPIAVLLLGWSAVPAVLAVATAVVGMAMLARRRLGGYTGDVLGAVQQAAETAVLLVLAAAI